MPGHTSPGRRPADAVARTVAYTINPIVLAPVFFGWALDTVGWPAADVGVAVLLAASGLSVVPLSVLAWMVRTGRADTVEVRVRSRRGLPFVSAFAGAFGVLAVSALVDWPTRPTFEPLVACFLANAAMLGAVTSRFKISLHAASVAGFVSMAAWLGAETHSFEWSVLGPAALCVPLVGWARVRDRAHSAAEVLAGTAFGLLVPPLELEILARLGWFVVS